MSTSTPFLGMIAGMALAFADSFGDARDIGDMRNMRDASERSRR
ncbi:hypothetical protein ACIPC1_15035 [Streptomyces sp. NPDC087263]